MAVLFIVESPRGTTETYDQVNERLKDEGQPQGVIFHAAARSEDGGLIIVEAWESEQAREKWIEKVDRVIEQEFGGFEELPRIRKFQIHNIQPPALSRV